MTKISQYILCSVCLVLATVLHTQIQAQKNCILIIASVDKNKNFIDDLKLKKDFTSKFNCVQYVQQIPALMASKGYISASVDSTSEDSFTVRINLFAGEKYVWNKLYADENIWNILSETGFHKESFNNKPFDESKVSVVYNNLLDYYADNGYPFAKMSLDSIILLNGLISAKLIVEKGILYNIDSIRVYGSLKISENFLHHYLDIAIAEPYNQNKLVVINDRLLQLPYIQQSQPWNITMLNSGAILNLYLQPKRSNEIYALIGFAPANEQLGGKLLLTGQVNLNLKNAFATGETTALNWQQLQPRSPRLNILFQKPYLFHSRFGLDFNFDL